MAESEKKLNIYEAITKCMEEIGAVGKDNVNKQQGFKYRGIDAVMNALNPALTHNHVFVVPEVLEQQRQERTTGKGTVLIWLYAKPLSNGQKNVKLMDELELGLNKAISQADSKIYRINRGNVYCDYDSTRRWHCNIVELNLLIC